MSRKNLRHLLLALCAMLLGAAVSDRAIELRNLGIAQLENEKPADAAETFQQLTREAKSEPLGWANLAIARLRSQETDGAVEAIEEALTLAPGDPSLLAIRGDIEQWQGNQQKALATYLVAARAAPDNIDVQYALHRLASTMEGKEAEAGLDLALGNLVRLRPDNLVVILQQGQRAVARGDRAAASEAFLRARELLWQAPPIAERAMQMLIDALEGDDVAAARTPAQRVNNVLVVTPMYQQGLRELSTGIQGVPILSFPDEPGPTEFGEGLDILWVYAPVVEAPLGRRALAVGDMDGENQPDAAWVDRESNELRLWRSGEFGLETIGPAPAGTTDLREVDLDNDGLLDLLAWGGEALRFWRGEPNGGFSEATEAFGLAGETGSAVAALDFDIEGDLDLVVAGGTRQPRLYRNNLAGPLERFGAESLPQLPSSEVSDVVASDLDRDGDLDLLFAHSQGVSLFDNLRQGEFADRTEAAGLSDVEPASQIVSADLDNDGWPDLALTGTGLRLLHNEGGRFAAWALGDSLRTSATFDAVEALDADNDGRLDLAVTGPAGLVTLFQRDDGFQFGRAEGAPTSASAVRAIDMDGDGDLDLLVGGETGVHQARNEGGNKNRWLSLQLRGLTKGNSKNNVLGYGATVEILNGRAFQFREVEADRVHFGLGSQPKADVVRVVWTNGVPQNRLELDANQTIVEEQLLKGSCPFLYTWDGERIAFVTDLLWGAPLGLPLAPGVWTGADPSELVHVPTAKPSGGRYDLRITEELWEAAFFDRVRLWVVDHPSSLEAASSLRIIPGQEVPDRVLATRDLRPVTAAWDGGGAQVTDRIARRDEVYADGFESSPYQGVAAEEWTFTFDLGQAPGGPVRLHFDGWIFPADASLNLAIAQRDDLGNPPPALEVETTDGWQVLMPSMGFPAGKTKTMVVDTPPLPPGARKLRIVTGQWLSWDRIAWSTQPADDEVRVVARLEPESADLHSRGFSRLVRHAPNGPHLFDYADSTAISPWLEFPGRYTRFGDVRELLLEGDDRYVVMAAGDEIRLLFDASQLPAPKEGWTRTVFLESYGWDKDADRNTGEGLQVAPLPYRGMTAYPYGPGDHYPAHLEAYVEEWLTREISATPTLLSGLPRADDQ